MDLRNAREQLFAASLEQFVAVRTELAVELAREGHKEDSRALRSIHRPSQSAWATNQVIRRSLGEVGAFFEASDQLRQEQHAMLTGQSERASYQAVAEVFRAATNALGAGIKAVLTSVGRNADPPLVERVLSNFRNSAVSEDRRKQLLGGQLENDIELGDDGLASQFGTMPGGAGPGSAESPRVAATAKPGGSERAHVGKVNLAREREEQVRAQKEELLQRLQAARDEESAAAQRITRTEAEAAQARAVCERVRAQLDEADRAATQARQSWRDTETTLRRAERDAAEARTALESATQRREAAERKVR